LLYYCKYQHQVRQHGSTDKTLQNLGIIEAVTVELSFTQSRLFVAQSFAFDCDLIPVISVSVFCFIYLFILIIII